MLTRRLVMVLLAAALTASAGSAAADTTPGASSSSSRGRPCGTRVISTPVGATRTRFFARGPVSCRTVRRVIRRYYTSGVDRCQGSGCFIRFRDGWRCSSTSGDVLGRTGRMGQCQKRRRQAVAYKARQ